MILRETGPVSFLVRLAVGRNRRCHQDQVCLRYADIPADVIPEPDVTPEVSIPLQPTDSTSPPPSLSTPSETPSPAVTSDLVPSEITDATSTIPPIDRTEKSYPKRNRKQVERFELSW